MPTWSQMSIRFWTQLLSCDIINLCVPHIVRVTIFLSNMWLMYVVIWLWGSPFRIHVSCITLITVMNHHRLPPELWPSPSSKQASKRADLSKLSPCGCLNCSCMRYFPNIARYTSPQQQILLRRIRKLTKTCFHSTYGPTFAMRVMHITLIGGETVTICDHQTIWKAWLVLFCIILPINWYQSLNEPLYAICLDL